MTEDNKNTTLRNVLFLSALNLSIKKSLKGEERLWIVFWGWFVSLLLICWAIHIFLGALILQWMLKPFPHPLPLSYLDAAFILAALVTASFRAVLVTMVWKCSRNTDRKLWSHTARAIIFLFTLLSLYGLINSICDALTQHDEIATIRRGNKL